MPTGPVSADAVMAGIPTGAKFTAVTVSLFASVTVPLSVGRAPETIVRPLSTNTAPCPNSDWLASIVRFPGVVAPPVWT
jgi:hypothetical protein